MILQTVRTFCEMSRSSLEPCRYAVVGDSGRRVFVKSYDRHANTTYLRGLQIQKASVKSRLFRAPRPLGMLAAEEVIFWEYLDNLVPLRNALVQRDTTATVNRRARRELLRLCGRVLGTIHAALTSTNGLRGPLTVPHTKWAHSRLNHHIQSNTMRAPSGPPHGDYGCANLFLQVGSNSSPMLTVLDACPNEYRFIDVNPDLCASCYADVSTFVASLYSRRELRRHFASELDGWVEEFCVGYETEREQKLDRPTVLGVAAHTLYLYQRYLDHRASVVTLTGWREKRFRLSQAHSLYRAAIRALADHT